MFVVGQKVVCIDDKFPVWAVKLYTQLPRRDVIYTIRQIVLGQSLQVDTNKFDIDVVIYLQDIYNPNDPNAKIPIELGFKQERFAPLNEVEAFQEIEEEELCHA